MIERIMSITLCALLVLSLCGCKSNSQEQSSYGVVKSSVAEEVSSIEQTSSKSEEKPKESSQIKGAASPGSQGGEVISSTYDKSNSVSINNEDDFWGSVVARITSEKVKALQSGMTYRQIIEALGKSSSAGHRTGYYEYVVDDDNLLMLYFDDADNVCTMSGEEMLKTLIPLKSHLNNAEKRTFYAIVVKNSNATLTVTSPNYKYDCASVGLSNAKIIFADGKEAKVSDIKQQQAVIIKHEKRVLTTDPPRVYAEEIIIQ